MSEELKEYNVAVNSDFTQEIIEIIANAEKDDLTLLLSDYHDFDVAKALPLLTKKQRKKLYYALDDQLLSDIFSYVDNATEYLEEMSDEQVADIIEEMASDDAVDLLEELDEDKQKEIFELLDDEMQRDVELINAYNEDLIGSRMTNDFVAISKDMTVKQAMRKVIIDAGENDNISTVFVTNEQGVYAGAIRLRDLVIAREQTPLEDIIITAFPFLYADALISDSLQEIKDYAEPSLPVLDSDNRLIGALTSEDVIEAIDDEITGDYAQLAGLSEEALEDALERKQIFSGALKRLPWLIVLLILDLIIGAYVGIFEAVVIGLPFIVSFQQLVSGMSGNTGTQTLAVTVSLLTDPDLTQKEKNEFLLKEIKVGLLIGLITGAISFVMVSLYGYLTGATPTLNISLSTGGAVGVAMFLSASIASLTGSIIPLTLHKLGIDPAVASGPLITTLNDLIAITVYYGFALILLL